MGLKREVTVVGGGLAGCEAAYRIAESGIEVTLYEMRPGRMTPAHRTGYLAELVCSNSFKSEDPSTAQGLLKEEMRLLGSLLLRCAEECRVPAGSALAVERDLFASKVTEMIRSHPLIRVVEREITAIPEEGVTVIATGPLTSDRLAESIREMTGQDNLYFYDAVAPIVTAESLDYSKIFRGARYQKGGDDYLNCPLTEEEYRKFYRALVEADVHEGHPVDKGLFFEGCMPVEVIARRGDEALCFGPMRPVGLEAKDGKQAYAVVQLRQEDREGTMYSLVGFQTRLRFKEQERVFRMIPGLEKAEFVRYGVMHRNTYINSPKVLEPTLAFRIKEGVFFAGQITGCEGYMESAATGILAGINAVRLIMGKPLVVLPRTTLIGALCHYLATAAGARFQPMNANFGLLPPLSEKIKNRKERYGAYRQRSLADLQEFMKKEGLA